LFYDSIHNPEKAKLNKSNKAVQRAEKLGDIDKLSPKVVNKAKQKESAIIKAKLQKDEILKQQKQLETIDKQLETIDKQLETIDKKDKQLIETIKLLKSLNIDSQTISIKTGLSVSEIESIN